MKDFIRGFIDAFRLLFAHIADYFLPAPRRTGATATAAPKDFEPVLAEISHVHSLGTSKWFEVVYYAEGGWHCYAGSKTFRDGETVLRWRYTKDIFAEMISDS